jgi:hypothetical protein
VLDPDAIVEEVDDLVGHPGRDLGAERQQRRVPKHRVATVDRLAGRVANVLREHASPVRRIMSVSAHGVQRSQELELLDRLADPTDRPSASPDRAAWLCRRRAGADDEQLVEAVL